MVNTTVYFATNRAIQGPTTDWHSYGADIAPPTDPSRITYAEVFGEGTDLAVEGSGAVTAISHAQPGGFQAGGPSRRSDPAIEREERALSYRRPNSRSMSARSSAT